MNDNNDTPADNVIQLTFVKDIPGMMRKVADLIEKGQYGKPEGAVFILSSEDGHSIFGWGETNELEMLGLMSLASNTIASSF